VSSLYYKSPAEQADATVNAHYRELEGEVLRAVQSRLAARRMQMDRSDVEEAYCLAWNGVWELIKRGEEIRNLTATLIEITWRRAVDTYRELRTGQYADVDIEERPGEEDFIEQLDDRLKLQRLLGRLRRRLNEKECEAVSLCSIQGYSRREAGEILGMEESALQRLMDSATLKMGGVIASIDARGCGDGEWTRLLRAFALGVLAEEDRDHSRATAHIESCAPCRRYVMCLRGLAAVMPPVGLPLMPSGHEAGILAHVEKVFSSRRRRLAWVAQHGSGVEGCGCARAGRCRGGQRRWPLWPPSPSSACQARCERDEHAGRGSGAHPAHFPYHPRRSACRPSRSRLPSLEDKPRQSCRCRSRGGSGDQGTRV
jgi:DNA-directed RNA polymerase specialized sigma24 family protein